MTKFDTVITGSSDDYRGRIARLRRQLKTLDQRSRYASDVRGLVALYEDVLVTIDHHRRRHRAEIARP